MLRSSKVDQEELIRRESYLRDNSRPFVWADPTTWPRRWGVTFFAVGSGLLSWKYYCDWARKPFFYSLYPRLAALAFLGTVGYVVGCLREYHYKTRDAVVEHYVSLHPDDFSHLTNCNGRAQILRGVNALDTATSASQEIRIDLVALS